MKRISSLVGVLVGLLGLAFVVSELASSREDALAAAAGAPALPLIAAVVLAMASMGIIGAAWVRCLAVLQTQLALVVGLRYYYVGQLGKYIPGGIWPVIGRSELARRGGVPAATAYASTILSLGLTYLAAILAVLGLLLVDGSDQTAWLPLLVLAPIGLAALHPRVVAWVLGLVRRVTRRPVDIDVLPWPVSIGLLLRHLPAWIGVCGSTLIVAGALDGADIDPVNIAFATTLSWVVGFLAIGVPGGIGVREAVFVTTATSLSSSGTAAAVALVARVVFILGDVGGATTLTLLARSRWR